MQRFCPSKSYRALLFADIIVFSAFFLLPQFQQVESLASAALELDGLGALISPFHPLMILVSVALRFALSALLLLGIGLGWYFLALSIIFSLSATAVGGLAVLTALDLFFLSLLYTLDGFLLSLTYINLKVERRPLILK